jgi:DNA-dependent RNA polymerase auxiliary subunit epsilon
MQDVRFGALVDVIKEFSISVQKIKKFKIEKIEMITSQMLQNEKENRHMVLQS